MKSYNCRETNFYPLVFILCTKRVCANKTVDVGRGDENAMAHFQSVSGEPFVGAKFVRLVEGTPYFKDEWLNGIIILQNGNRCKGRMKLNLFTGDLLYKDVNENIFVAAMPITQIILTDTASYRFSHVSLLPPQVKKAEALWYQKLYADTITLYKSIQKKLLETRPYNSATYEQTIRTETVYVFFYKNRAFQFKKLKEVPLLFIDKKNEIETFLKTNNIDGASMDDKVLNLAAFLNSLLQPTQ